MREIARRTRNPEAFGVEFVDVLPDTEGAGKNWTGLLKPSSPLGLYYPDTGKIKVARNSRAGLKIPFTNKTLFTFNIPRTYEEMLDTMRHEFGHQVSHQRQLSDMAKKAPKLSDVDPMETKHTDASFFSDAEGRLVDRNGNPVGPGTDTYVPAKGVEGEYWGQQGERDARSTERSGRIMDPSDYNTKLAKILSKYPKMSVDDAMKWLRTNYRLETSWKEQGIKSTPRQISRRDKQTMAALQAAEKNMPDLSSPEARRAFERAHQSGPESTMSGLNRLKRGTADFINDPFRETISKTARVASFLNDPTEILFNRLARNLKPGPAMAAGVAGGLAGEYIVKPAAENLGVFDAVGEVSKAAFERMPPAAVDAADKALGAAQFVLNFDPFSTYNEFLANQARQSKPLTPKQREEAEKRHNKQNF